MVPQSRPPRLILTRPRAQAERFATSLTVKMEVVFAPLIEIAWQGCGPLDGVTGLILTSENGALALRGAAISGRKAYCVGPRTTEVARGLGLDARDMGGTADHLVDALVADGHDGVLLHLRGAHTRGEIAARLRDAGLTCEERVVYDQLAVLFPADIARDLAEGAPDFVTLFSPRTAGFFAKACPCAPNAEVLCLSRAVADALDPDGYGHIEIAAQPTAPAMAEALYRRAAAKRLEGPEASR